GVSLVPASVCQIRVEGVAYTDVLGNAISIRLSLASRMEAAPAKTANFLQKAFALGASIT
ncbi:MAG: LysR family transcriptional regulator, partial [Paraburkholderia graminis]